MYIDMIRKYFNSLRDILWISFILLFFFWIKSSWSFLQVKCTKYCVWGFRPQRILKFWVQSPNDDTISIVLISVYRILSAYHKLPIPINYRSCSCPEANFKTIISQYSNCCFYWNNYSGQKSSNEVVWTNSISCTIDP